MDTIANIKKWIAKQLLPDLPSRCFLGLIVLYCLTIVFTFGDYGINPDEQGHMTYGLSVVKWYTSGFQNRQIFSWTNTWLYGGFFDTITYLVMQISPLDFFETRHLCTAAMGMLGVIAAYRIGCLLGSGWAGLLAALFLILTPRYYGHAFNNHKDIPFAVLYLWGIYWQLKILRVMPRAPWHWIVAMGSITGLAMGIRVGGVMLMCFAGFFWLLKCGRTHAKQCLTQWIAAFLIAYSVMLLFWPWAQTNPIHHPLKALKAFTDFSDIHTSFFEGQYVKSTDIPWYYAFKWLLLTLPEFIFGGLLCGLAVAIQKRLSLSKDTILNFGLLIAASLGPLIYVAWSNAPLYNGIRHVLFTLPPLVILSALGLISLIANVAPKKQRIIQGIFVFLLSFTLWKMLVMHPHQYTFFNHIYAGGIAKASQNYETDYWDNSYKAGADWLHSKSHQPNKKTRIFSAASSTRFLLDPTHFEMVSHPWAADFYLVSTALERHRVIPGDVAHIVRTDNVPLLYIIKPNAQKRDDPLFAGESPYRLASLGSLYRAAGQEDKALSAFLRAIALDPQNTWLYIQAGELYLDSKQPEKALHFFQKVHDLLPPNANVIYKMGLCYDQLNNLDEARKLYAWAVELRPYFNPAYRSLGDLLQREKRYTEALVLYREIVNVFPESLGDWHRIGITLYYLGDYEGAAIAYQNLLLQDPDHTDAWLNLALMLYEQGKWDESLEAYDKVIAARPDNRKAVYMKGRILVAQKKWDQAIDILENQTKRDTLATDSWLLIAQAYRHKNDVNNSQQALASYIKTHGDRPDGWLEYFELGKLYHQQGQTDIAQVIYQATSKMLPNHVELQDSLRALSH